MTSLMTLQCDDRFMFKWNLHIFHNKSRIIWNIITKFYKQTYHGYMTMSVDNNEKGIIDDVTMYKNKSQFEPL